MRHGAAAFTLNREAVRDAMPAFFEFLNAEKHPEVRVVLGYFVFVYIHPSYGRQRAHGTVPDEPNDGGRRIPLGR